MPEATITLPIRTVSEANVREHWAVKARRAKGQRLVAKVKCAPVGTYVGRCAKVGIDIHLVRIGVRKLDTDNLARSMKAVRDGVSDALGIDDGDPFLRWRYSQKKGKPKEYAVEVRITW